MLSLNRKQTNGNNTQKETLVYVIVSKQHNNNSPNIQFCAGSFPRRKPADQLLQQSTQEGVEMYVDTQVAREKQRIRFYIHFNDIATSN